MAIHKRKSKPLDNGKTRAENLATISANLTFSDDLTLEGYKQVLAELDALLEDYNQQLSIADAKRKDLEDKEQEVEDLNERMLQAVAVKFGKRSAEYKKAGGTPKDERKAPVKKKSASQNGTA